MTLLALTILNSGVQLSMLCAVIGLVFAFILIALVIRSSAGNERMRQIAAAVQEGAKAYLKRQVMTISAIAVIIFVLLFFYKDHPTAIGFVIGAFCSLSAGYIGMRIAVIANVRTTQAATHSLIAALRVAFNGGAVTGLLVVGLALLAVSIFYTVASNMVGHDVAVPSFGGLSFGAGLISGFARLRFGDPILAGDAPAFSKRRYDRRPHPDADPTLFRVRDRAGHDRCRGGDHKLLHVDALSAGAENCARVRDRPRHQHYRRARGRPI